MWYTYVLKSQKDDGWYIGCTNNLKQRFNRHNSCKVSSTKDRTPFMLIYYEACFNKTDAFRRERYLKSGYGYQWLKKRMKYFIESDELGT